MEWLEARTSRSSRTPSRFPTIYHAEMAVQLGFHLNPQWQGSRKFPLGETYDAYMRADLKVTSSPALDPLVFGRNVAKGLFEGRIVLQVVGVVDTASDPEKEVEKSRRCLKLRLSDGHTDIQAIEQSPLSDVSNLVSGAKVLLIGPLLVRNGLALVGASNVMVMSSA